MASDFNKPVATDAYATLLTALVTELQDIIRGLEPTATGTHTNIPTNTIRWNATNIYWEKYNGTSWVALAAPYAISISGNAATATSATTAGNITGVAAIGNGGTGQTSASAARTALGAAASGANADITSVAAGTTVGAGGPKIGYLNVPVNSQSINYTLVAGDAGNQIYHPTTDTTARIFTIPANASVAYDIGTTITFTNDVGAGALTIAINTDTLVLAGTGTTGSRTLAAAGIATATKVTATRWMISGTNLS